MTTATAVPTRPEAPPALDQLELAEVLVRLTYRVKQAVREVGDQLGLSVPQLDVLRQLYDRGPTPMSRLADVLNCDASNLTGLVDKLEARSLVERRPDASDRRVKVLALTDEGERTSHEAWFALIARCPFQEMPAGRRRELIEMVLEALGD